jgi:hypothetical protein
MSIAAANPKLLPHCLLDRHHKASAKILSPHPGSLYTGLAAHLVARQLFNPHRSRSGSVQRILSAMLRPEAWFVPPQLIAGALRIES